MELARYQIGVLEGSAMDFLLEALGRAMRESKQLDQVIGRIEGAAARFGVHERQDSRSAE